ncbi:Lon protease family protein [Salidesulfovibrio onnuriiensis]|uniref:Lon protease family protein n=1 Tax=Salidesulfovibrio onnuriiensis TaxID=2583823 RepID=UPI0011C8CEF8|nr:ATP-binding protein [Salidesulfovibrio onnuriiensis]
MKKALDAKRLRARLDPEKVPFTGSEDLPARTTIDKFQPRAIQALTMALRIKGNEYNVYVAGQPNMGRTYFVKSFLAPLAAKAATPQDWVYLYNFEDEDKPIALPMPAGQGRKFKNAQSKAMGKLKTELPLRFEKDAFQKKHENLIRKYNLKREKLFAKMEEIAAKQDFKVRFDEEGVLTLTPVVDGKVVGEGDFDKLDPALKKQLKARGEVLLDDVSGYLRQINKNEQTLRRDEDELHRKTARSVLKEFLGPVRERFGTIEGLKDYFELLEEEVVENFDQLLPKEPAIPGLGMEHSGEDFFTRFEANLFVDNSKSKGAPVVMEDHPTVFNLLGSIERESEMGALYTDHTLIKAGAIHKANHGYLVLNVEDLLANTSSWEGLLRALRAGQSRIEDPVEPDQVRARTIQPGPIPLELRVVLIGTDEHYEMLLYHDDRFAKYFKLKAHLQSRVTRTAGNIKKYLAAIGEICRDAKPLPLTREALAGLVDFGSQLAEDQKRLSLYFPLIRERIMEASALAEMHGKKEVDAKILQEAIRARDFRSNLYEAEFMADYDREVIKVSTGGEGVGQVNGLSVTLFGDYEFGLPHRIACTVGVGHGGILDLEREAELGGPIHTKAMMILKSYLIGMFAQDKPIVLTGSLCFEQSYAGIEGDSASGAELVALLSALAGMPVNLSYAFTGAVSLSGAIMAVGGVTSKIEGFFQVCHRRGLTGKQGVLIPADNVDNLMLGEEVVRAVEEGKFHIHPIKSIEEAVEILMGARAGSRGKSGKFPLGSVYRRVDDRLAELAELAVPNGKKGSR